MWLITRIDDGGRDALALEREHMRELGYRTVDALVDWLDADEPPVLGRLTPAEAAARLGGPPPEHPEPYAEVLDGLFRDVLPFTSRDAHPRYFAYTPFAGTWPGALGDLVASACNVYSGSWQEGSGPTQLELEILRWFADWIGYPASARGALTTGGSQANLTAIACAREARVGPMREDLVVYVSDQTHSSVARGARVLGFRPGQVRVLPVGEDLRLDPKTLVAALDADEAAGRTPLLLVANAGATSTGAVDPVGDLAAVCRERGLWLHVDAAYGGFAVLTERGRAQLGDLSLADSVTLDPHKWLYQPFECGCLLVRDGSALRRAFEISSDYLRDAEPEDEETNFADLGLQLTRGTRAFKLWLSLRTFGLAAFRDAIDRCLDLAAHAVERIERSECLELAASPSLSVVCFRRAAPPGSDEDALVDGLVAALTASGIGLVSSTRVHGRPALRLCILNHSTRAEDVERVLAFFETAEPTATVTDGYDRTSAVPGAVPLFARLRPAEAALLATLGNEQRVAEGAAVVSQWETSRDLYVLERGTAEVRFRGEALATLRDGDYFGEIGALEWGAGFARSRAATVVAIGDLRLRVLSSDELRRLLDAFPRIEAEIRRTAHERLRTLR